MNYLTDKYKYTLYNKCYKYVSGIFVNEDIKLWSYAIGGNNGFGNGEGYGHGDGHGADGHGSGITYLYEYGDGRADGSGIENHILYRQDPSKP